MSPIFIPPPGGSPNTVFVQGASPIDPAPRQMARNGLYPTAAFNQKLRAMANHVARYRTRQVACFSPVFTPPWSDGDPPRIRWRTLFRTSPFASQLRVVANVFRQQFKSGFVTSPDPAIHRVKAFTLGGSLVGTATLSGGPAPFAFPDDFLDGPENYFYRYGVLLDADGVPAVLPTDTELHVVVTEENHAITLGCAIYEETLPADTVNGYIDTNAHVTTPITSQSRKDVADILRAMWGRGAAHLVSWSRLLDNSTGTYGPPSVGAAGFANAIDTAVNVNTASSPGFTLDLRNNTRLSTAGQGVRVFLAAYGMNTTPSDGAVYLRNSGGTGVTVSPFGPTPGWVIGSAYLPNTVDKYDLFIGSAAGTFTVEAASAWLGDY